SRRESRGCQRRRPCAGAAACRARRWPPRSRRGSRGPSNPLHGRARPRPARRTGRGCGCRRGRRYASPRGFSRERGGGIIGAVFRALLTRFGYAALGAVYAVVGAVAVKVAILGSRDRAAGFAGALRLLLGQPHGVAVLGALAAGLAAFVAARFYD